MPDDIQYLGDDQCKQPGCYIISPDGKPNYWCGKHKPLVDGLNLVVVQDNSEIF